MMRLLTFAVSASQSKFRPQKAIKPQKTELFSAVLQIFFFFQLPDQIEAPKTLNFQVF